MSEELVVMDEGKIKSAKTITTIIYVLQAISFLIGITFIVAVVINYIKKGDVQGTWLDSHFRWQIRTFWLSLLWLILGLVTYFILSTTVNRKYEHVPHAIDRSKKGHLTVEVMKCARLLKPKSINNGSG